MSHSGRSGPPEIRRSYSLLVLNVSFRTTSDDLFLLFDRYGEVVDINIPRDRRTGDSRGFAFVRYNFQDEAQMAVDKLDGRMVNGREIRVQFAKYGPNAERIYSKFQSQGVIPEAGVQDGGVKMIIRTETIEAKAGAEVGRDMNETSTGTEVIVTVADLAVLALIMTGNMGDTAAHLCGEALVISEAPRHIGHLLVK